MNNRRRSTVTYLLIIYALLVVVVALIFLVRHHFFVKNLYKYQEFVSGEHGQKVFPLLEAHQSLNVGWAHYETDLPSNSYMYFSKEKARGKIRIGMFGDSFMQGSEVELGFDFPSFLQQKFIENGYENVEVINFGVHGYGMHQAFLLWKYLGKSYELDYTVFMPFHIHAARDRSFVFLYNNFGPIHARYILQDGALQLVPVLGSTRVEAGMVYNAILPPWDYVRYDEKPPSFLRALLPIRKTLPINPFYYHLNQAEAEILKTYALLFRELGQHDTTSIVICNSWVFCDLKQEVSSQWPIFFPSQVLKYVAKAPSVYTAPRVHLSALGNQLRANELFYFLMKSQEPELKVLDIIPNPLRRFTPSNGPPLSEYQSVEVQIHGHSVASFMGRRSGDPSSNYAEGTDFRKDRVASLLWIAGDKNLKMIPVPFLLSDQEAVYLQFDINRKQIHIPIGRIHASSPYVGSLELVGRAANQCFSVTGLEGEICFGQPDWSYVTLERQNSIDNLAVVVGKTKQSILRVPPAGFKAQTVQTIKQFMKKQKRQYFRLKPTISKFVMLRVQSGQFTNIETIKDTGTIDLAIKSMDGEVLTYPIVRYQIIKDGVSHIEPSKGFVF